ncbi:TPA: hypothetical protein EYP83_00855 [Candidatus Geothermarchaeota archaeon]|nr:hypothetical protein [Candidatus Geothermarchaeota archaeon]
MLSSIIWLLAPKKVKETFYGFKEYIEEAHKPVDDPDITDKILRLNSEGRLIPRERFVISRGGYSIIYGVKLAPSLGVSVKILLVTYRGLIIKRYAQIDRV